MRRIQEMRICAVIGQCVHCAEKKICRRSLFSAFSKPADDCQFSALISINIAPPTEQESRWQGIIMIRYWQPVQSKYQTGPIWQECKYVSDFLVLVVDNDFFPRKMLIWCKWLYFEILTMACNPLINRRQLVQIDASGGLRRLGINTEHKKF